MFAGPAGSKGRLQRPLIALATRHHTQKRYSPREPRHRCAPSIKVRLINRPDVAVNLNAKRAIDQGARQTRHVVTLHIPRDSASFLTMQSSS